MSSASSFATPSLIVFGAPSAISFASFNPKPVASLITLITAILFAPVSFNTTVNSDFSAPASAPAAPPAAGAATAAVTPYFSSLFSPFAQML